MKNTPLGAPPQISPQHLPFPRGAHTSPQRPLLFPRMCPRHVRFSFSPFTVLQPQERPCLTSCSWRELFVLQDFEAPYLAASLAWNTGIPSEVRSSRRVGMRPAGQTLGCEEPQDREGLGCQVGGKPRFQLVCVLLSHCWATFLE
nr:zinc finger protein 707 isoform X3 [Globicephala melas]